jgi:hypothetical protein
MPGWATNENTIQKEGNRGWEREDSGGGGDRDQTGWYWK